MDSAGGPPLPSPARLDTRSSLASAADWLGWDVTLVRVLYVVLSIVSVGFPGILAYIILWILMPLDS